MLEWMHDQSVVKFFKLDFASMTLDDCERFIDDSLQDDRNTHLAITDESDVYLGTVSLKNITDESAELAISIRSVVMGQGVAAEAMEKIIEIGFDEKHLKFIYWCVSPENIRAVRFYDKNCYCRVSPDSLKIEGYDSSKIREYYWYLVTRDRKSR